MKILHIDIETAPNIAHVWGLWKQNIGINQILDSGYVMCFAAKWHESKRIQFYKCDKKKTMLNAAWDLLSEADAVVHYNGKNFDIPTLNKEFIENGYMPPDPYHQIDLLQVARSQFRFPSNKLDYVAKALGLDGKVQHKGHELWIECMAGDKKAWKEMERYNKQDVQLLEDVYNHMLPWIKGHPNHFLYADTDRPICPNCGSDRIVKKGIEHTTACSYQRYRCKECGTPIRGKQNLIEKEKRKLMLTQSR